MGSISCHLSEHSFHALLLERFSKRKAYSLEMGVLNLGQDAPGCGLPAAVQSVAAGCFNSQAGAGQGHQVLC